MGDGPYREELQAELPDAIFTGYLSGEELATAYASADIFAFPSTTDTFGNVVLEAQASGLPCVVSDEGGPRELVEDEVNGLITKAKSVGDFTRALQRLVEDRELLDRLRDNAYAAVKDRNWNNAFLQFWADSESSF